MNHTRDVTITEEWLASVGFKWHQFDRQPQKHWLLWIGSAIEDNCTSISDLGIELSPMWFGNSKGDIVGRDAWFCWLRSDMAGKYSRFIHTRHIRTTDDVVQLFSALTGQPWDPENNLFGNAYTAKQAAQLRAQFRRPDVDMMLNGLPHRKIEADDTIGGALPEHVEEYEEARK